MHTGSFHGIQEVQTRGSAIQGHPQLHSDFHSRARGHSGPEAWRTIFVSLTFLWHSEEWTLSALKLNKIFKDGINKSMHFKHQLNSQSIKVMKRTHCVDCLHRVQYGSVQRAWSQVYSISISEWCLDTVGGFHRFPTIFGLKAREKKR